MRIKLPKDTCARIAATAVSNARSAMSNRGWKSSNSLSPMSDEGLVGIRTTTKYLMFQESGTKPHVQHELAGKVIPMKGGSRFANPKSIGTPGYVSIPGRGKVWRDQRWRHPGVPASHSMQNAIEAAIKSEQSSIRQDIMRALKGELT